MKSSSPGMGGNLSSCLVILILVLAALSLSTGSAFGQATNQITGVDPSSGAQGTTNLLVTFTLDTDAPPAPPAGAMPESVMIGSLSGTSVTHTSQYIITAVFDIPTGEPTGPKDATITFVPPEGGTLVFSMTDGFTVTAGADTPPSITQHPQSQTVPPGGSVTFTVVASGTEPLSYQWQHDGGDIAGATATSYIIDPVAEADAGNYRCVVTNDFGTATSDEAVLTVAELTAYNYPIVDTGQITCYSDSAAIACPAEGVAFYGQDAQYDGSQPSYTLSGDGLTVYDNNTGLTWQQAPDTDGDGDVDSDDKLTWTEVQTYPAILNAQNYGAYNDWRLPTIKELYSLIDFSGIDPSGYQGGDTSGLVPFIDTAYFAFAYGDESAGERIIDAQYWSGTEYVGTTMGGDATVFGVNFADGRIKGYPRDTGPGGEPFTEFVRCVRGNADYGVNGFVNNGDGTVTDLATGLMWMHNDSGTDYNWEQALDYAEDLSLAGYDDWRLPNAKELQSIVDYTRSPSTTGFAAIDPVFNSTSIIDEAGDTNYPFYWTGTTHANWTETPGQWAAYVAFGEALGYMGGQWTDVHGAGAQRSDPKLGDPNDWSEGNGPQGDAVRIDNYVRCVRDSGVALCGDGFLDPDEQCDDGNTDPGDGCDETCQLESEGCPATPQAGCGNAGRSILMLKDQDENGPGANDKLVWKWLNGPATIQGGFGDPLNTTDYRLCLYTGSTPAPVMEVNVPAVANWRAIGTRGYKYLDRSKAVDGIFKIMLRAGGAGQSKAMILGRDGNLPVPGLPLDMGGAVVVQLSNSDPNGNCWEESFTPANISKNTNGLFKAKTP